MVWLACRYARIWKRSVVGSGGEPAPRQPDRRAARFAWEGAPAAREIAGFRYKVRVPLL